MIPIDILRRVPIFSELSDSELHFLSKSMSARHYAKGDTILHAEEEGSVLFVLAVGRVKVAIFSPQGREVVLTVLQEGSFFGEMALFDNEPRSADVVATEDSQLYCLKRADFLHILKSDFSITLKILREMCYRIREANSNIDSLALMDVYGRLARYLLRQAREAGKPAPGGYLAFKRPTHQDIAAMIGTSRETVSRLLHSLAEKRTITCEGKIVFLPEKTVKGWSGWDHGDE